MLKFVKNSAFLLGGRPPYITEHFNPVTRSISSLISNILSRENATTQSPGCTASRDPEVSKIILNKVHCFLFSISLM